MVTGKDVAKFLSGVSAVELLNHAYLAISNVLPINFCMNISKATNFVILAGWIILFGVISYYAWIKK